MKVLAVSGLARVGKDTFCSIAINILAKNGINAKRYSFAEQLKKEVAPFLHDMCRVSPWTTDEETKKDIRDFLVWYGTTFWRKRDPKRWIRGVDTQIKVDANDVDIAHDVDVAIITDVRYPNEAEWVHSLGGYLIHISAWRMASYGECHDMGGGDFNETKKFFEAPNEQERINDPLVKEMSDYKSEWKSKGLTPGQAIEDIDFKMEVRKALDSCAWFTGALFL